MKKSLVAVMMVLAVLAFVGCTTIVPVCATSNPVGAKVGESTAKYLFGYLPMGKNADMSIKTAAKNGGITKISTVDKKLKKGLFVTKVTTVVTGE